MVIVVLLGFGTVRSRHKCTERLGCPSDAHGVTRADCCVCKVQLSQDFCLELIRYYDKQLPHLRMQTSPCSLPCTASRFIPKVARG